MRWISHRGNINGAIPDSENNPSYVEEAIMTGYDVEIDIWKIENDWWLGHDKPQYKVSLEWLTDISRSAWCHLKNSEAFELPCYFNRFWHDSDDYVFTSKGYVLIHSGLDIIKIENANIAVCMMPEHHVNFGQEGCPLSDVDSYGLHAICTDNIDECRRMIDEDRPY